MKAAGIPVYLVVVQTPAWAGAADSPPPVGAYADFMRRLSEHFRGRIMGYEVWNEPNEGVFWKGGASPAAYTQLLKAAHSAVKSGDPAAKVGVGGLIGNDYAVRREALPVGRQGQLRLRRPSHRRRLQPRGPARGGAGRRRADLPVVVHRVPRGPRHDAGPRRRPADLDERARLVGDHRQVPDRLEPERRGHPRPAGALPHPRLRLPGQRPLRRERLVVLAPGLRQDRVPRLPLRALRLQRKPPALPRGLPARGQPRAGRRLRPPGGSRQRRDQHRLADQQQEHLGRPALQHLGHRRPGHPHADPVRRRHSAFASRAPAR